jgi:PIN domain nuclease of toxin-antitoxin system
VILLDTNALIWSHLGHARSRPLRRHSGRLRVSPASILELRFLLESGRLRAKDSRALDDVIDDERWKLDEPSSGTWFREASALGWTRDPFDRLIVAHAGLRGWRLATGDGPLIDRLGDEAVLPL